MKGFLRRFIVLSIVCFVFFSLIAVAKSEGTTKLSILKTGPKQAAPGSVGTYQIRITNTGKSDALKIRVQDKLPSLEHFISSVPKVSSSASNLSYENLVWQIGTLKAGEKKVITYKVLFPNIQQGCIILKNTASVLTNDMLTGESSVETLICATVPQPKPPKPTPSNPIDITINPPQRICINTDSKFVFTFTGGTPPYKYTVDFGDETKEIKGKETGKFVTLLHNYTNEGMYTIVVNASDIKGTTSTLSHSIRAEDCEVVLKVYHHNFVIGYPDENFKPNRKVTRAEIATMLTRALGLNAEHIFNHFSPFSDVKQEHWAFNFIKKAYEEKLMLGDKKDTFRPDSFATRAEIAAILVRLRELKPEIPEEQLFTDVKQEDWFNKYIYTAVKAGLIQGYPDHTFKPNKSVTRAEFVTMFDRALYREDVPQIEQYKGLENIKMFPDVTKGYWAYRYILEAAFPHIITYAARAPVNILIPSKTIPIYLASTKTIIIFPQLNTTVTAIVPVDGIKNGKDPKQRNVHVKIINKEKP